MDTRNGKSLFPAALVLMLALVGCRTYGGYGSEEGSYAEISAANQRFAQQLSRAEADLRTLEQAAASNAALATYAARYRAQVAEHRELLEAHQATEAALSGRSPYRDVGRAFRAILSEQQLTSDQYQRLLSQIWQTTHGRTVAHALPDRSAYEITPPFYSAIAYQQHKLDMATSLGRN